MLTGLMYHRPEDPLGFLENCLQKTRELGGPECVAWDTFIMPDRKPLPPITTAQGKKAPCKLGTFAKYNQEWLIDVCQLINKMYCQRC